VEVDVVPPEEFVDTYLPWLNDQDTYFFFVRCWLGHVNADIIAVWSKDDTFSEIALLNVTLSKWPGKKLKKVKSLSRLDYQQKLAIGQRIETDCIANQHEWIYLNNCDDYWGTKQTKTSKQSSLFVCGAMHKEANLDDLKDELIKLYPSIF